MRQETLLHTIFIEASSFTQVFAQFREQSILRGNDTSPSLAMSLYLFIAQLGPKALGYVGGTYHLGAKRTNEFYRACVDSRYIGNGVHWRIFHCDTRTHVQKCFKVCMQFLPGTENTPLAWQRVQHMRLNRADQCCWGSHGRNKIKPAARIEILDWQ